MVRRLGLAALVVAGLCAGCAVHKPPAPVAAAPAPATPEQNFIVFFPDEGVDITSEGQAVVDKIASEAKTANPAKITVMGEDDGGTAHDAEVASERGAHVAAALIAAGLAPSVVQQVVGVPPKGATSIAAHKVVVKFTS